MTFVRRIFREINSAHNIKTAAVVIMTALKAKVNAVCAASVNWWAASGGKVSATSSA